MQSWWSLFSGGWSPVTTVVLLAIAGWLAVSLRHWPGLALAWIAQQFVVTLSFDSRDEFMFATLTDYMNEQQAFAGINNFTVRAVRALDAHHSFEDEVRQGGRPRAFLSPGEGFHVFRLDGRMMWLRREVEVAQAIIERIRISTFGRERAMLQAFVDRALAARVQREVDRVSVFMPSPYNAADWYRARIGNRRSLASVILKTGQSEGILADLTRFFASQARYEGLGIPWRRGYLLMGPPGTGKTSLVTALASELKLNVCALSLASSHLTDERIHSLLSAVPPRSALLIEDIDAFFRGREQAASAMKLSFSAFLNALDGVATHEGSVLFMTTNHPERLDPAIVRAGRIDYRLELGLADRTQLAGMCRKFFPVGDAAERFAAAVPAGVFSPARVQEALMNAAGVGEAIGALAAVPAPLPARPASSA